MTILYNCKHSGDQYQISKFDDGELISSYLCTTSECDCPAGVRPMCRHREMLPKFINRNAVNTGWWFDYDRGGWVDMRADVEFEDLREEPHSQEVKAADFDSAIVGSNPAGAAKPYRKPNDGRRV